ncbi:cytochrome C signal peptide protein [bacterium]|nr:cytochrome C signal peptide protein [bacterium]
MSRSGTLLAALWLGLGMGFPTVTLGATPVTETEAAAFQSHYLVGPSQGWPVSLPHKKDIPPGETGKLIRRGIDILERTSYTIGPHAAPSHRAAVNNLNCVSCHAMGDTDLPGTRPGQLPFVHVIHEYPKFDPKSMSVMTIQDRVRGMSGGGNGRLTDNSDDMKAIVAYFQWLGHYTRPGSSMAGAHLKSIPSPTRMPDSDRGKVLYQNRCAVCHGDSGLGIQAADFDSGGGYVVPPIAGTDSFTDGGHLANEVIFARFIWGYMPKGATPKNPQLKVMDAYDIARYVSRMERKKDPNRSKYYPSAAYPEPTVR